MKEQETTFYEQMQNSKSLDLRSNIGKRHNLAFVLLGLVIALLRKRDGFLSSIHRSMENMNKVLCSSLSIECQRVVSRSHLPILLKKVDLKTFEGFVFSNYGIELSKEEKEWFAADGKDLKGSIEKGDKRGEAIVILARHSDKEVLGQTFYSGKKESEKPTVRALIEQTESANQKITADALHLNPATTELVNKEDGVFVIGLKGNQKKLLAQMEEKMPTLDIVDQTVTIGKDHGRVERRTYFHYDIRQENFDIRWADSNFQSLFEVKRERYDTKTEKESETTDLYISNGYLEKGECYFTAIRQHWSVETHNHIRDVTLKEDKLTTKIKPVSRIMAGFRTLVIKILALAKPKNMVAQLELFQDDFASLMLCLRNVNFL